MPPDNTISSERDPDNIQTLMNIIEALELSPGSMAQLTTFIQGLTEKSKPQFQSFLTYILKFVEYNCSWYLQLQIDLNQVWQELKYRVLWQILSKVLKNIQIANEKTKTIGTRKVNFFTSFRWGMIALLQRHGNENGYCMPMYGGFFFFFLLFWRYFFAKIICLENQNNWSW